MPERVVRRVARAVLYAREGNWSAARPHSRKKKQEGRKERGEGRRKKQGREEARTTLDDTAPLMLPKEMTMASETERLYEPSTLFETHAMMFGMFG